MSAHSVPGTILNALDALTHTSSCFSGRSHYYSCLWGGNQGTESPKETKLLNGRPRKPKNSDFGAGALDQQNDFKNTTSII